MKVTLVSPFGVVTDRPLSALPLAMYTPAWAEVVVAVMASTLVASALLAAPVAVLLDVVRLPAVTLVPEPVAVMPPLPAVRVTSPPVAVMLPTVMPPWVALSTTLLSVPAAVRVPMVRPLLSLRYTPPLPALALTVLLWVLRARASSPTSWPALRLTVRPTSEVPAWAARMLPVSEVTSRLLVADTVPVRITPSLARTLTFLVPVLPLLRVMEPELSMAAELEVRLLTVICSRAITSPRISAPSFLTLMPPFWVEAVSTPTLVLTAALSVPTAPSATNLAE